MSIDNSLQRAAATHAAWTAAVLMVPLLAMQITDEVDWGVGDFVAGGVLIFGARMAYLAVARRPQSTARRFAWAVFILLTLAMVWAELAVGLFS
jgi:uncharacterized membrane protein YfcA